MREIKFRAWLKKEKKMAYFGFHNIESDELDTYICGVKDFYYDENIMQYTGLKDKNGKEIYEGDIVQFADYPDKRYWLSEKDMKMLLAKEKKPERFKTKPAISRVEWNFNGEWAINGYNTSSENWRILSLYEYIDKLSVIGNIYENPERLGS